MNEPLNLEEIEEAFAKTTQGEWQDVVDENGSLLVLFGPNSQGCAASIYFGDMEDTEGEDHNNAYFIAHSHRWIPLLVAEVDSLRKKWQAEVDRKNAELEQLRTALKLNSGATYLIFGADEKKVASGSAAEVIISLGKVLNDTQMEVTALRQALEAAAPHIVNQPALDQVEAALNGEAGRALSTHWEKLSKAQVAAENLVDKLEEEESQSGYSAELQALRTILDELVDWEN